MVFFSQVLQRFIRVLKSAERILKPESGCQWHIATVCNAPEMFHQYNMFEFVNFEQSV